MRLECDIHVNILYHYEKQTVNAFYQDYDSCYQFTHYSSNGLCFAWDVCLEFSASTCTDCISGDASCSPDYICSEPGLCNGVQIGFSYQVDEAACLDACKAVDGCRWYSYDSADDFCLLSESCRSVQECQGDVCAHGQVECELETPGMLYHG